MTDQAISDAVSLLAAPVQRRWTPDELHMLVPMRVNPGQLILEVFHRPPGSLARPITRVAADAVKHGDIWVTTFASPIPRRLMERRDELDVQLRFAQSQAPSGSLLATWAGEGALLIPAVTMQDVPWPGQTATGGQLCARFGPLDLGRFEFMTEAPKWTEQAAAQTRQALLAFAALGNDQESVVRAIVRAGRRSIGPAIRRLRPAQLYNVTKGLLANEPTATRHSRFALFGEISHSVRSAFAPSFQLSGWVAPRLFGVPLAPNSVWVSGHMGIDGINFRFVADPSALFGLPGVSGPFDIGLLRLTLPMADAAFADGLSNDTASRRLEEFAKRLRVTVAADFAPFGLPLSSVGARMLMPAALGGAAAGTSAASPSDILRATSIPARRGQPPRLSDPGWDGSLQALSATLGISPGALRGQSLRSVFPGGGLLWTGQLQIPQLLIDGPWAMLDVVATGSLDQLADALEPVSLIPLGVRVSWSEPPPGAKPLDALAALANFKLAAGDRPALSMMQLPRERGVVGSRLLGLPLAFGDLTLPADAGDKDQLVFDVAPKGRSWLAAWISPTTPRLSLRVGPGRSVPFALVRGALSHMSAGSTVNAGWLERRWEAALFVGEEQPIGPREHHMLNARAQSAAQALSALIDPLTNALSAGAGSRELGLRLRELAAAVLPRLEVHGKLDLTRLPLPPGLTATGVATLRALSPRQGRPPRVAGPRSVIDATGGIAAAIKGAKLSLAGLAAISLPDFELEIHPRDTRTSAIPQLRARMALPPRSVQGIGLQRPELLIDTGTAPKISIAGKLNPIVIRSAGGEALLRISSPSGSKLLARFSSSQGLQIQPARLTIRCFGVEVDGLIHSAQPKASFGFSARGSWSARVTVSRLRIPNPLGVGADLIVHSWSTRSPARPTAQLRASGTKWAMLDSLSLPEGLMPTHLKPWLGSLLSFVRKTGTSVNLHTRDGVSISGLWESSTFPWLDLELHKFSLTPAGPSFDWRGALTLPWNGAVAQLESVDLQDGAKTLTASIPAIGRIGIANLLEVQSSNWSVVISNSGVQLETLSRVNAWVLGAKLPSFTSDGIPRINIPLAVDPKASLATRAIGWVTLLSNRFRFRPEASLSGSTLTVRGDYQLLKRNTSGWRFQDVFDWSLGAGNFERDLTVDLDALLGTTGVVVSSSGTALKLGRNNNRWRLRLIAPTINVLWSSWSTLNAEIDSDRRAAFTLSSFSSSSSPFKMESTQDLEVRVVLASDTPLSEWRLPAAKLTSSSISSWPDLTIACPWTSSIAPNRSGKKAKKGRWVTLPTLTRYRASGPEVRASVSSSGVSAELRLGSLQVQQKNPISGGPSWVDAPFTPIDGPKLSIGSGGSLSLLPGETWPVGIGSGQKLSDWIS